MTQLSTPSWTPSDQPSNQPAACETGPEVADSSSLDSTLNANWHELPLEHVCDRLSTSTTGLDEQEAGKRLERFGHNHLRQSVATPAWVRFFQQFNDPMIYVLLCTAVITALLQHWVDTGVILGVVIINAIIGFIQESKAEKAIDSLKQMLAPSAFVLRNGQKSTVPSTQLVPGDVVYLHSGDKVPADMRLFHQRNLQTEEAALTGESLPVHKNLELQPASAALGDRRNMAFAGTLVSSGTGAGVVVATGNSTQLGQIASMLDTVGRVDTPLLRRLAQFGRTITWVVTVACIVVFVIGVLSGKPAMEMLLASVALAVSAIPEGLPAIMTIALACGVKRMAARSAIVRKLPAVEALGSATVICSDKTGTLTRNEMMVSQVQTADGLQYQISGTGYAPIGAIRSTTGPEDRHQHDRPLPAEIWAELSRAMTLCNNANLRHANGNWTIDGDPTEAALLVLAAKTGEDLDEIRLHAPRHDEIPFESELQYMATLHHDHRGQHMIYAKGSPERILQRCSHCFGQAVDNQDIDRQDIDHQDIDHQDIDHRAWRQRAQAMASEGLRVLALARKSWPTGAGELDHTDLHSMELLALVGIIDPPRPEAIEAVAKCHQAGIQVKMITGDHVATAQAIAEQLGLKDAHRAVSGDQVEQMTAQQLEQAIAEVNVFARVSPAHKLKFVQALQRQGHVVAMTGDGVNDAPALKQADIGVAMGITGTEVSKEAAKMVLLDDNFASIERAVEEGRTVFDNLKKTIAFILPTNGGQCLTLIAALMLGSLLPILPIHILWINLVTTVALAITLAFDPPERESMKRPPRNPNSPLIDRGLLWRIFYVSILMAGTTFGLFFYELQSGAQLEAARAVAVNSIVFFQVFYLFNSRNLSGTVLNKTGLFGNRIAWYGVAAVIAFQAIFTYWPVAGNIFQVAPMDIGMWLRLLAAAGIMFIVVEAEKWIRCSFGRPAAETGSAPQA